MIAAPIDTSLGGFVKLQLGAIGEPRADRETAQARLDGEVHLELSGQTDTGVAYGGRVQIVPAAKPRDNATFMQAGWAWGEVRLGAAGGAVRELSITAPTVGIGQIDGDLDRFGGPSTLMAPYALANDDSLRLTYVSPAVLGVRFGLSYAPELASGGYSAFPAGRADSIDRHRNLVEAALSLSRDLGAVTVGLALTAVGGEAATGARLHDLTGGSIGANLAWNGLTVGGAFIHDGGGTLPLDPRPGHLLVESVTDEFQLGAAYAADRWKLGLSWAHDARRGLPTNNVWGLGAVYRVADGVTIAADLMHYTVPSAHGLSEASALIVETGLRF